ncbi:MAG TPA: hypothetical protein VKA41_01735 [Solirubrobacterales bacterium]|nr:hypothetical protein [Solirubrobacterales bacterium]
MSGEAMERAVQQALAREGIDEQVLAAGQFNPRGHTGSMFVGGLAGGDIGAAAGSAGEAVGEIAGAAGGMRANEASSGMPQWMLVGVTAEAVYGFDGRSRSKTPGSLIFSAKRAGLEVKVHQRVNVRVLELIHPESGSRIELEGSRVPVAHAKDVIGALSGR